MDILGHVQKGVAPLEINFSVVDAVASIVKWLWYFGDGSFSTEATPRHAYVAPGIYTVSLTVTDEFGNVYHLTKVNYIYVYSYTIGIDGLISGYTDQCWRHAIKPSQGQGITPFGGRWLWPAVIASTAKGYTENHENVSLVVNAEDMRIYRIGVPEIWTDREGGYDETEIPCEAILPEITSRNGEHENVRHIETHVSMRSWDEKNYKNKPGFSADGYRNSFELSIEGYEKGQQIVPTTKLQSVQIEGDYAYLKELEARRLQFKLKYSTSAFRTTKIESHCQEIDHRTPPQLNDYPEKRWQKEFSSPDIWFSCNKPAGNVNRADGTVWTGITTPTTGPDLKQSAFHSMGLSGVAGYTISDFIISGWMTGDGILFDGQVAGGGAITISVITDLLIFSDGVNLVQTLMTPSATWRHLAAIMRSGNLELYENGRLKISQPVIVRSYGGNCTVGNGTVFDLQRIPRVVSAEALYFYYESVLDGGGGFLP